MALWHMEHDDADEEDLEEYEVVEAMRLAQEYEAKKPPEKVRTHEAGTGGRVWSMEGPYRLMLGGHGMNCHRPAVI